jgi:L-fuculose-phosphate aldolase
LATFVPKTRTSRETEARREMCGLVHRAYDQQLFTSTQGTFSVKLDEDTFLITPYDTDRRYLEPGDPVLIHNGEREAGKTPSHSVALHRAIYRKQSHVQAVIIAHAPHIMAFAVTEAVFDSRTIPESYIMLRHVPKIPFASSALQPELTADVFVPSVPVAIVENDAVIVTGSSLLNAFDRLEVAEYSARGIIDSRMIGDMIAINDAQVAEIEDAFNLPK